MEWVYILYALSDFISYARAEIMSVAVQSFAWRDVQGEVCAANLRVAPVYS